MQNNKNDPDTANRRPLASRQTGWAHSITAWLAKTAITPNQISIGSMLAAAAAGGCFWASSGVDGGARIVLLLLAVVFCQLRLLCNLFDGMVAVEAGKHSPDGAAWNEFPDRVADILIFAGCGIAAFNPSLGWAAATFAVFTAYTRELGIANHFPADFSGPMAKQHRMFVVSAGSICAIFDPLWPWAINALFIALWVVVVGSAITCARRLHRLLQRLRQSDH